MNRFVQQFTILMLLLFVDSLPAAEWSIPVAGNAYRVDSTLGRNGFQRGGTIAFVDPDAVFSVYFRIDRPAHLRLSFNARVQKNRCTLETNVDRTKFSTSIESTQLRSHRIGDIEISEAGYVRVDLRQTQSIAKSYAEINDLIVSSDTDGLSLDYVKNNKGNMFYWGRRGPSVHLRYEVPQDCDLQYAYSEITVPIGQDPVGSYYMANGFAEGYFGFQVNSTKERRVLFSVWSPFKTDNPRDIPKDQRITPLAHGPKVHIGKFGNEGSGGQSFLVYPWRAGITYRFLTEVEPDGKGNTVYTSWFGDKSAGTWSLIAQFQRPMTNTHLRGFHSFLESFSPTYGHVGRRALYGNVWVNDIDGQWHECTRARFSVDATGRGRHRLDFSGGTLGKHFFMRNCGFFNETGMPGATFTRVSTAAERPDIDFDTLPRE